MARRHGTDTEFRVSGTVPFLEEEGHGRIILGTRNGVCNALFIPSLSTSLPLTSDSDPFLGPVVRIAPNHLSFSTHEAQKVIYGFGTREVPSMRKDPIFFTPEVDHSMNIINETNKEEHSRMRRMLSYAFGNTNLLENEDVLVRRTDEFIKQVGNSNSRDGKRGIDVVRAFNYVTFNIMGKHPVAYIVVAIWFS